MGQDVLWGNVRKHFLTQRVVRVWNALPGREVEAGCLTSFKKYQDECWARHHSQGSGTSAGKWG